MAEPCGCGVFIADENSLQGLGDTVKYCPMHAAAGDMLAALDRSYVLFARIMESAVPRPAFAPAMEGYEDLRDVVAAARSGAPRPDVLGALVTALKEAGDHLEYCGYGDAWEREAAVDSGLREKIADALALAAQARGGA